jgi:hypothetical protein
MDLDKFLSQAQVVCVKEAGEPEAGEPEGDELIG